MLRDWKAVSCPRIESGSGYFSTLKPTYGKDAVALVLCQAREARAVEPLPVQTVATLILSDGSETDRAALADQLNSLAGRRALWSGHYRPLVPDSIGAYRQLREVRSQGDLPADEPGTLILLEPALIRVRKGAPDAVIRLRKAYSAALDESDAAKDSASHQQPSFGARFGNWLQAWLAAIGGLNVRFNVGNFFRQRAAEWHELFPGAHRGRLKIWKS